MCVCVSVCTHIHARAPSTHTHTHTQIYIYILWECWSLVNHYGVMCRTKCNIILRVLNIYDRAIIIIMIMNKYIFYIYLIHGKYCSATYGFMKFTTTFIRLLRRWDEIENRKCDKMQTKSPLRFRLYVFVSVWVYMGVGICVYVWMRVFKLSQARNVKRWL